MKNVVRLIIITILSISINIHLSAAIPLKMNIVAKDKVIKKQKKKGLFKKWKEYRKIKKAFKKAAKANNSNTDNGKKFRRTALASVFVGLAHIALIVLAAGTGIGALLFFAAILALIGDFLAIRAFTMKDKGEGNDVFLLVALFGLLINLLPGLLALAALFSVLM